MRNTYFAWKMFLITVTLFPMLVLCSITFSKDTTLYEGDRCINNITNGENVGRCLSAYKCSLGLQQIQKGHNISICNFSGKTPIICCPLSQIEEENNLTLDSAPAVTAAQNSTANSRNLFPLPKVRLSNSTGTLSEAKCLEYYPRREYTVPKRTSYEGTVRLTTAAGARPSLAQEFPHMAVLGFGETDNKQWLCGGSLISLRHVLTAAHCLHSRDFGNVKYVRLGDLNLASDYDRAEPQDFNVKRAIFHPNYDSSTVMNDIAVIELDRPVRLSEYVRPACLHVGSAIYPNREITATGWGVTQFLGNPSSHLLKVNLKISDKDDCQREYFNSGPRGKIDDARQVCAESAYDEKIMDTCKGDSGGPLQMRVSYAPNMNYYHIIGVTSFGKPCGISQSAGIYTRVSFYLPWIESLVFK